MTKALAMLFFLLSVTMFSIGLFRYLMQFDAPVPPPYPPLKVEAYAEMQRRYGEDLALMPARDEFENADTDTIITTATLDLHSANCN